MTTYYFKNTVTGLVSQNSDHTQPQAVTRAAAFTGQGSEYVFQRVTVGTGSAVQAFRAGQENSAFDEAKLITVTNIDSTGDLQMTVYQKDRDDIVATADGSPTSQGSISFTTGPAVNGYEVNVTGTPLSDAATDNTATHCVVQEGNSNYGIFHLQRIESSALGLYLAGTSTITSISSGKSVNIKLARKLQIVLSPGEQAVIPDVYAFGAEGSNWILGITNVSASDDSECEILMVGP